MLSKGTNLSSERTVASRLKATVVRIHPSDGMVIGLLALAVVVAAVRYESAGFHLLTTHVAMLLGFVTVAFVLIRRDAWKGTPILRAIVTTAVIFTCYTTLGTLGMRAMPATADVLLSTIDQKMCGFNPSLALQAYQSSTSVEFFAFFYSTFIVYINLSLLLNCLGRPQGQRDAFLTGWVIVYCLSYLGYIFLPARGPGYLHANEYDVILSGGYFYRTVVEAVESTGGLQGVFPSLHVGGSVYWCAYDLRVNRLRGLTYLPIVLLIYGATLFLRYHYVIDLIVGTVIAIAAIPAGERLIALWSQRRVHEGLPAFPGGPAR